MDKQHDNPQTVLQKTIIRLMHQSMRGFRQFAAKNGLSMTQMIALRQIYYHSKRKGCTVSDIGENLGVSNPAASQLLDKLVQTGLISRQENPDDRRSKRILLTPQGEQFLKESMMFQQSWIKKLLSSLSHEEIKQITNSLLLITTKLEEIDQ